MRLHALFGFIAFFGSGVMACNTANQIDQAVDCGDLCGRYRDCFDSGYDTSSCRDRCEAEINSNPGGADQCDGCLDASACVESGACLGTACAGIIP